MIEKATSDLWWKNAVVYCVDVATFLDSDGDGMGDLPGLTGLGVLAAGVWAGLAWGRDGTVPLLLSGSTAAVLAAAILAHTARSAR